MPAVIQHRFKRRKPRVKYDSTTWAALVPGFAIAADDPYHAHAIETFGARKGWRMRRETVDGKIMVGRVG